MMKYCVLGRALYNVSAVQTSSLKRTMNLGLLFGRSDKDVLEPEWCFLSELGGGSICSIWYFVDRGRYRILYEVIVCSWQGSIPGSVIMLK
jgi:hypothetical protein